MAKNFCKWPVIAVIIVGTLILISASWCCIRCCCRKRRDKRQTTFFNDPVPAYAGGPPQSDGFHMPPPVQPSGPPPAQYAYFDSSKNNDDLPVMPSWNGAKSEKVEDPNAKATENIELSDVDNSKHQQQQHNQPSTSGSPPRGNHMPLGADPSDYHGMGGAVSHKPKPHPFPPSRMNTGTPFGPGGHGGPGGMGGMGGMGPGMGPGMAGGMMGGAIPPRLNTPFDRVHTPPVRIQSPYPEANNMPTASIPTGGIPYGAAIAGPNTTHDDYDFNPHINSQNQGPYANADIYPPEPAFQQPPQFTGTTGPVPTMPQQQQPQFTGTTVVAPPAPIGTPAPYQRDNYTGGTAISAVEQYPPQQIGTPAPYQRDNFTGATAISSVDQYPSQPVGSNGQFVAQMDDDYGAPPPSQTYGNNNNNAAVGIGYSKGGPAPVVYNNGHPPAGHNTGFDVNDFDHGGYGGSNNNNGGYNNGANQGYQDSYQNGPGRPGGQQHNGGGYDRPPQQGWSAF